MQDPQRWETVWVTMQAWADLEARPPVRWVGLQVHTYSQGPIWYLAWLLWVL